MTDMTTLNPTELRRNRHIALALTLTWIAACAVYLIATGPLVRG